MRKVIVNTTPLIALADIGQLELLHKLYEEILIPEAVWEEVESEPAKTMVSDADWIKKVKITHTEEKRLFRAKLHAGEVEAIILADENAADLVIMDDNAVIQLISRTVSQSVRCTSRLLTSLMKCMYQSSRMSLMLRRLHLQMMFHHSHHTASSHSFVQ